MFGPEASLTLSRPSSSHSDEASIAAAESIGRAARIEPRPARADATHDLYERYSRQVFGFCVNRLGSRDEAEDAAQSTFLNAHRALQRGVTPESELAWLFKIAHNVCLTRRRSARRRVRVESASDLQAMQDVIPAPVRESADQLIRLADALAHMPENQRRAILLREWQGFSYHEIGAELGLSQSAVETLIFRARRALAANLEVEPERTSVLARAKAALDIGSLLAAAKTLFGGGAAIKAAAAAVAVSGAAVVATSAPAPQHAPKAPSAPAAVAPEQNAPIAAVEARATFASTPSSAPAPVSPAAVEPSTSEPSATEPVEAAAASAPVATPAPKPEQARADKSKEEKAASAPAQSAPIKQSKPDKAQQRPPQSATSSAKPAKPDKPQKAAKPPEPVPPVAVTPVEPVEPSLVEPGVQKEEKQDSSGGNGHRK